MILRSLLNFDLVSTPEKCCNRPKIVAIAEIATLFSLGGVVGVCVGKALDNAFLESVAKCVLNLLKGLRCPRGGELGKF